MMTTKFEKKTPAIVQSMPGLAFRLYLFSALSIFPWGVTAHAANDDALFIDENGKVRVQDLEVNGNIKAGEVKADKLTGDGAEMTVGKTGRLDQAIDKKLDKAGGTITGSLNVNGKVVIGTDKPDTGGSLTVKGEIWGKPWYSEEYTWKCPRKECNYPPGKNLLSPVKMLKADQGICFLTFVQGKFAGAGEAVNVDIRDGYWHLSGTQGAGGGGVTAKARCIGMPPPAN
jgi:hypothetical protein